MNLMDMHCDTLWKMIQQKEYDLMENPWSVSIPVMKEEMCIRDREKGVSTLVSVSLLEDELDK